MSRSEDFFQATWHQRQLFDCLRKQEKQENMIEILFFVTSEVERKKLTREVKDLNFLTFFDESGNEFHVSIGEGISYEIRDCKVVQFD